MSTPSVCLVFSDPSSVAYGKKVLYALAAQGISYRIFTTKRVERAYKEYQYLRCNPSYEGGFQDLKSKCQKYSVIICDGGGKFQATLFRCLRGIKKRFILYRYVSSFDSKLRSSYVKTLEAASGVLLANANLVTQGVDSPPLFQNKQLYGIGCSTLSGGAELSRLRQLPRGPFREKIFFDLKTEDVGQRLLLLLDGEAAPAEQLLPFRAHQLAGGDSNAFFGGVDAVLYKNDPFSLSIAYAGIPTIKYGENPGADPVCRAGGAHCTNQEELLAALENLQPVPREKLLQECGIRPNWQENLITALTDRGESPV